MRGGSQFGRKFDSLVQNPIWPTEKEVAKHAVFATTYRNRFYGEVKRFNPLPNVICMFSIKVVDDFWCKFLASR